MIRSDREDQLGLHYKKSYRFSRPQRECHLPLPNSPWPGIINKFPASESLVSDIPAGGGKIANFFFTCWKDLDNIEGRKEPNVKMKWLHWFAVLFVIFSRNSCNYSYFGFFIFLLCGSLPPPHIFVLVIEKLPGDSHHD